MSKTIKLNESLRRRITAKLMDNKFSGREKSIEDEGYALAQEVYRSAFSAEEFKLLLSLPYDWMAQENGFRCRLGGFDDRLHFSGDKRLPMPHARNFAFLVNHDHGHPLTERYCKWRESKRSIREEKEKLSGEIRAVVYSATTVNKLITIWPEIKDVVLTICNVVYEDPNLPAPKISYLNEALGLKPAATTEGKDVQQESRQP
jgi:hypothetical protein